VCGLNSCAPAPFVLGKVVFIQPVESFHVQKPN